MQLHIVKKNNEFVIINPPDYLADNFFIKIDKGNIISGEINNVTPEPESDTYKKTKALYKQMPDDDFIRALHESTPPDYQYKASDKTDDELMYDALKVKYELGK